MPIVYSKKQDEEFMEVAIKAAVDARNNGNDPFGAVLVKDGRVVTIQENKVNTLSDPTAHAECLMISNFCRENSLKKPWLGEYTLYSSAEPCMMCSGAIHWSRVGRIVFSASQEDLKKFSGGNTKPTCESLVNVGKKKVVVTSGVLREKGLEVFKGYSFS